MGNIMYDDYLLYSADMSFRPKNMSLMASKIRESEDDEVDIAKSGIQRFIKREIYN